MLTAATSAVSIAWEHAEHPVAAQLNHLAAGVDRERGPEVERARDDFARAVVADGDVKLRAAADVGEQHGTVFMAFDRQRSRLESRRARARSGMMPK